jgi:VIT1/CCC1 family predicted Fe2+/Mn2+ transporter
MTQVHVSDTVSDAKDMAESVAAQAVEYAGTVTEEVKSLAGDVAHEVAQRVHKGVRSKSSQTRQAKKSEKAKSRTDAKRPSATRRLAWGLALAATAAVVVLAVVRSRRDPNAKSPPVTNLGPEAGTDSDVPGPAFDPEGSPMSAEASGR